MRRVVNEVALLERIVSNAIKFGLVGFGPAFAVRVVDVLPLVCANAAHVRGVRELGLEVVLVEPTLAPPRIFTRADELLEAATVDVAKRR